MDKVSKRNLKGVDRRLITLIESSSKEIEEFSIPLHGGIRTPQIQNNFFHKIPKITLSDGFRNISNHQKGKAFSINCSNYKTAAKIILEKFNSMRDEKIFKDNEELIWNGDRLRIKDITSFELVG